MFPLIGFLFLAIPILEIYLLIQVGEVIGAGWTILLVVLTALWFVRNSVFKPLRELSSQLRQGRLDRANPPAQSEEPAEVHIDRIPVVGLETRGSVERDRVLPFGPLLRNALPDSNSCRKGESPRSIRSGPVSSTWQSHQRQQIGDARPTVR